MTDLWAPVTDYEGIYEAGPGMVRSLDRVDSAGRHLKGRILKPGLLTDEYGRITHLIVLCKNGTRFSVKEHRVICEAFHGECPEGMETCHWDGNSQHNHPDNLYWGTKSQNQDDSKRHGTHKELRKTHCPQRHALIEPNLRASKLLIGHRVCLACSRGSDAVKRKGGSLQEVSDRYYAEIMYGQLARTR